MKAQKFSVASIEQKAKCGLLMRIPTPWSCRRLAGRLDWSRGACHSCTSCWEEDWNSDDCDLKQELEGKGRWSSRYGDRFSCLVLIGVNMDKEAITRKLNDALLTEKENVELGGVKGWRTLTDPFFEGAARQSFLNYTKCQ